MLQSDFILHYKHKAGAAHPHFLAAVDGSNEQQKHHHYYSVLVSSSILLLLSLLSHQINYDSYPRFYFIYYYSLG